MVLHNLPLHCLREVYRPWYSGYVATYRRLMHSVPDNIFYGILAQSQCSLSRYKHILIATTCQVRLNRCRLNLTELRLYEILCRGLWGVGYAI